MPGLPITSAGRRASGRAADRPRAGFAPTPYPWVGADPAFPVSVGPLFELQGTVDFLGGHASVVARRLLGQRLVSSLGGVTTEGIIVETEAYGGPEDPASHAAVRAGMTRRNRTMFAPAGRAYVYRSYGVHWCLNVVTGDEGDPQAVLIRGLDARIGEEMMLERRHGRRPIAAGPGRVCEALAITGALDGHDLFRPPLILLPGWIVPDRFVGISGRIGVRVGDQIPHRFFLLGSRGVSR